MPAPTTSSDGFLLHGEPFRILSGAMHYFRVHPDQWADRLRKARLMGLNTVETYVPWNLHQPEPGTLVLDGLLDLPRYLRLAHAEGLERPRAYSVGRASRAARPGRRWREHTPCPEASPTAPHPEAAADAISRGRAR